MKHPAVHETDPSDVIIGRTMKNWLSLYPRPSILEKTRLIQTATAIEKASKGLLGFVPQITPVIQWLVDTLFLGPVEYPIIYSHSRNRSPAISTNITFLMAERGSFESMPVQMGLAFLTT